MALRGRRHEACFVAGMKPGERGNTVIVPTVTVLVARRGCWKAAASDTPLRWWERPAASAAGECRRRDPAVRGESRKSKKAQGSIGRAVGGNTGGEQRTLRWSKALRSGRSCHFGDGGANDERAGSLETGRSAAEEGKASEGGCVWRKVGRLAATSSVGTKPGGPHGRQRGATNPQGSVWSKPSES
jgi:hypothetical protein